MVVRSGRVSAAAAALALGVVVGEAPARALQRSLGSPPAAVDPAQRPDLEAKMRISRAEAAFADTREAAEEMTRLAADLSHRVGLAGRLEKTDAKTLERIRKLARRVRGDLGGYGDMKLEHPPDSAKAAAVALGERATEFQERFSAATRYATDARLIALAAEISELSDLLRSLGAR